MSTDSFHIPIQAQPNAQTVEELFDEAWHLIVRNIRSLAKGKPNKTIVESFLDLDSHRRRLNIR